MQYKVLLLFCKLAGVLRSAHDHAARAACKHAGPPQDDEPRGLAARTLAPCTRVTHTRLPTTTSATTTIVCSTTCATTCITRYYHYSTAFVLVLLSRHDSARTAHFTIHIANSFGIDMPPCRYIPTLVGAVQNAKAALLALVSYVISRIDPNNIKSLSC